MRRRINRPAFTLVEILIVLGIIILLAGLLLPVIGQAREAGRRAVCLNNLRMLTQAWLSYADENERHFCSSDPNANIKGYYWGWVSNAPPNPLDPIRRGKVWPFVNDASTYRCPDDPTDKIVYPSSYSINGLLAGPLGLPFPFVKLDELTSAPKTFVFIEQSSAVIIPDNAVITRVFMTPLYPTVTLSTNNLPGQYHKGAKAYVDGCSISFADGHAIFWQYSDPRIGSLQEALAAGLYGPLYVNGVFSPPKNFLANSPDVLQLEAWSGGQVPKNAVQ
jgi:type II secretory pathway pseudopilin PulG